MRNGTNYIFGILLSLFCLGIVNASEWDEADQKIRRVNPREFFQLPTKIIQELNKRGCTVPQSFASMKLHNAVSGEFAKAGQKDWAVLCSRGGYSSVLIFWGGDSPCPSEMPGSKDKDWLQGSGNGIEYSRLISGVGKSYIDSHFQEYGGEIPPNIQHEGINDSFIEKASAVYYCHDGKWLDLTGAD